MVDLLSRIQKECRLSKRCNNDWANIWKDLQDDDWTAEEQRYASVAEGETGFIAVLLDCHDMKAKIDGQLSRLNSLKKQHIATVELEPAPRLDDRDPNVVQTEAIQAIREAIEAIATTKNVRSQNLLLYRNSNYQLPTFDGDVLHWQEFWDMFQSSVNMQELPPVTKFTYLKGILRGQAAAAISGIAVTEENYDVALHTLPDKYRRKDVIVESLYTSFQKIPIATNEFADV